MNTYERLSLLMEKKGVSLYKIGKDNGIPYSTLSDWKTGRCNIKVDKLMKVAEYFDVPITYFFETDEIATSMVDDVPEPTSIYDRMRDALRDETDGYAYTDGQIEQIVEYARFIAR